MASHHAQCLRKDNTYVVDCTECGEIWRHGHPTGGRPQGLKIAERHSKDGSLPGQKPVLPARPQQQSARGEQPAASSLPLTPKRAEIAAQLAELGVDVANLSSDEEPTMMLRQLDRNICQQCGNKLQASDGHYHSTPFPVKSICCACKGHGREEVA